MSAPPLSLAPQEILDPHCTLNQLSQSPFQPQRDPRPVVPLFFCRADLSSHYGVRILVAGSLESAN